ncbi:MAG TPA: stage III sporulation protein AF [Clostridia bacterium]|nr:stage III sporulation protein AF [Clostridia bacterium]
MEAVRSWAVAVCLAALAAGMAGVVAPGGNLEKSYKFAVSLFFLCCLLTPLFGLKKIDLNLNLTQTAVSQTYDISDTVKDQEKQVAEDEISQTVRNYCVQQGVTPKSVKTTLIKQKDGKFSVGNVTVIVKQADAKQKNKLISFVKKELGLDIKVNEGG